MAYQKRAKSKSRSRASGYSSRKRSTTRSASKGRRTSGRGTQTLRIVVEQPQAASSMDLSKGIIPANQNAPRKAMF